MMMLSQFTLEDVEALYLGPSFLMADPMGPLLDQDEEEALSPSSSLEGEVPASPPLSLSPYSTLLSPPSPPLGHCSSFLDAKGGALPWLSAGGLLDPLVGADDSKDDAFTGIEWMAEKIDLSDLDLESLVDSCSSEECPGSPEDLLDSLHSHMDLDLDTFDPPAPNDHLELERPAIPPEPPLLAPLEVSKEEVAPSHKVVMKSEPCSPPPSPPASTMCELGSEVDTKSPLAAIIPDPSGSPIVVVVLSNKDTPPLVSLPELPVRSPPTFSDCDSDSGIESVASSPAFVSSPAPDSSRTKPYAKPEPASASSLKGKVKSVSGAPKVVEKKLKKMEQNKTAATRYRQKKRVEQELLGVERDELEKKNRELAEKAESISREIQYLKDLMEEVRKHHRGKMSSGAT
ncbi:cyclic AMP-dependent transcription factor ATF-4 [Dunckerocampus dactyliophorus]|uniref:cyclic AMP-dependent transcription factor ATF-4 n=1 Tax=Dunckerocampus dactyliophorus TaxID=161453 RepID=UPI002406ECFF|nr:cyclic AMP-dependent transcription factor ATF-4 [Dunckerocampus dactyliophorus]